jgi:hypothetical protein
VIACFWALIRGSNKARDALRFPAVNTTMPQAARHIVL